MNGKQAKMLRSMGCGKKDRKKWKSMNAKTRGMFRDLYRDNVKMVNFSFAHYMREINHAM